MDSAHVQQRPLSRREAMRHMAIVASGLAVGLSGGCTPLKIGLSMHPRRFDTDPELRDLVLRAFATTVIPGVPADAPNLVRVFDDEAYPLARFSGALVSDLCDRGNQLFRNPLFSSLTADQRTQVIENALHSQSAMRQLYEGAIFLVQVSCYAGIYDASAGCEMIDFQGANLVARLDQTYPHPERYLAHGITVDGNYA